MGKKRPQQSSLRQRTSKDALEFILCWHLRWVRGLRWRVILILSETKLEKTNFFPSLSGYGSEIAAGLGAWGLCPLPLLMLGPVWNRAVQALCVRPQSLCIRGRIGPVVFRRPRFPGALHPLCLLQGPLSPAGRDLDCHHWSSFKKLIGLIVSRVWHLCGYSVHVSMYVHRRVGKRVIV